MRSGDDRVAATGVPAMLDHPIRMPTRPRTSSIPASRAEAVATELRELIREGTYAPGDRLRQVELAGRFGVSTTPLREALLALTQEGLVQQDAQRGFVVFEASPEDLADIYAIRVPLEAMATESAAARLTPAQLDALGAILDEMRDASPRRYIELNHEFHSQIYAASGRPRLTRLIESLRREAAHYIGLNISQYDEAYAQEVQLEHEGILQALRSGTPKRAGRAVREHLEHHARHTAALIAARHPPPAS
ncbi:MAG: GntR family transcriptional regulator [Solirubrobacteraceae bacterium]